MYSPCSHSSPSFLPLPATPTLSPLNPLTLDLIKRDPTGKVIIDDTSGLPLTPTVPSPPFTPFKSSTFSNEDFCSSPTFASPPVTPLIKYHFNTPTSELDSTLPSTPTLTSPPFTPLIKNMPITFDTPSSDGSSSFLPSTPTFHSPPFTKILQDTDKDTERKHDVPLLPLPETPTLPSPTFTPLIHVSKDGTPISFNPGPLPETPTFGTPPCTPTLNNAKQSPTYTPLAATPTMDSPLHTPGFALHTPSSPFEHSHNMFSRSELDREKVTLF